MEGQGKVSLPEGYISTVEAASTVGCSISAIHAFHKQGRVNGFKLKIGNRSVLALEKASTQILADLLSSSKRIRRNRQPLANPKQRKAFICKGYRLLYMPNHPHAYHNGYVREHVVIAEQTIGRALLPSEVVHHIDGDKLNNSPDNLKVYADHGAHMKEAHNLLKEFLKAPRGKGS